MTVFDMRELNCVRISHRFCESCRLYRSLWDRHGNGRRRSMCSQEARRVPLCLYSQMFSFWIVLPFNGCGDIFSLTLDDVCCWWSMTDFIRYSLSPLPFLYLVVNRAHASITPSPSLLLVDETVFARHLS